MFNLEGGKICVNLNDSFINSVAKRFPVVPLNLPVINPFINGMIAEEIINDVNKKSALNLSFKNAEKSVINEVKIKQIIKHKETAKKGGKF